METTSERPDRSEAITIRLTVKEKAVLEAAARAAGMSTAAYVRIKVAPLPGVRLVDGTRKGD